MYDTVQNLHIVSRTRITRHIILGDFLVKSQKSHPTSKIPFDLQSFANHYTSMAAYLFRRNIITACVQRGSSLAIGKGAEGSSTDQVSLALYGLLPFLSFSRPYKQVKDAPALLAVLKPEHGLENRNGLRESLYEISNAGDWQVGQLVEVAPRTWPGCVQMRNHCS